MSYNIYLKDRNDEVVVVPKFAEGGTYAVGGTTGADLNVTYNYSKFYYAYLDTVLGIRWLYGTKGSDCLERLESAIAVLGTERSSDYWEATPGNAGYALSILRDWAKLHPGAVFDGD